MLEIFHLPGNQYAIIPVMFFQNKHYSEPLRLYIPPKPPYTLWGMHFLNNFPKAPVFITDDLIIALANPPSPDGVFLFNPGRNDWIDDLYLKPLKGRDVYYMTPNPYFKFLRHDSFSSGVKLMNRLHSIGWVSYVL